MPEIPKPKYRRYRSFWQYQHTGIIWPQYFGIIIIFKYLFLIFFECAKDQIIVNFPYFFSILLPNLINWENTYFAVWRVFIILTLFHNFFQIYLEGSINWPQSSNLIRN
jgi:hypothetical protein